MNIEPIYVSLGALLVSLISLGITLFQKSKETKRTIRKTLSDTLESITKINTESTKLRLNETQENLEYNDSQRRNYNSQRRILITHADFLVTKYDSEATEIDCNILAGAYSTIGDQEKAEVYWTKAVQKSSSKAIKHLNLRGFGIFLFNNDKINEGRKIFQDAINISFNQSDENLILISDTYLLLGVLEKENGDIENQKDCIRKAMDISTKIKNERKKKGVFNRIKLELK